MEVNSLYFIINSRMLHAVLSPALFANGGIDLQVNYYPRKQWCYFNSGYRIAPTSIKNNVNENTCSVISFTNSSNRVAWL